MTVEYVWVLFQLPKVCVDTVDSTYVRLPRMWYLTLGSKKLALGVLHPVTTESFNLCSDEINALLILGYLLF